MHACGNVVCMWIHADRLSILDKPQFIFLLWTLQPTLLYIFSHIQSVADPGQTWPLQHTQSCSQLLPLGGAKAGKSGFLSKGEDQSSKFL